MSEKWGIDDKTKFLVLYLDAHMSIQEIMKILNRNEATVRFWVKRIKNGQDIRVIQRVKERPKLITDDMETKIIQMIKENPEGLSLTKIATRIGGISASSIGRVLTKHGFKYKAFDKGINYTAEERIRRVEFCKKMLLDDGKIIYQTFYSDEMSIELNKSHKTKAWTLATENIKKKNATDHVRLNCWGAISAQGATSLEIYENGMNGKFYREVISRHIPEMENLYSGVDFYFYQDNHPAHKKNEEWLVKEQKLKLISSPKYSPDLNIIENLWSALKERVTSDAPANEKELRASLLSNWDLLTKGDRLQPFFEGLHRRYYLCIAKEGHKFRY